MPSLVYFFDAFQVVGPYFADVVLVDPVQLAFLSDAKGLESSRKNFIDGFVFFLGLLHTLSLFVKVSVPVCRIEWLAFSRLKFGNRVYCALTFFDSKEGEFLRKSEAHLEPGLRNHVNVPAQEPGPGPIHLPCQMSLQIQMHLKRMRLSVL